MGLEAVGDRPGVSGSLGKGGPAIGINSSIHEGNTPNKFDIRPDGSVTIKVIDRQGNGNDISTSFQTAEPTTPLTLQAKTFRDQVYAEQGKGTKVDLQA